MDFQAVVDSLRAELDLVEGRLKEASTVDFPLVGDFLEAIVAGGGKRLRPILLLLAARPYRYDPATLIPAAAGVELLHTASLVHDDTIDHALFRRGQPTLNSAFPTETVILLGDYLFAQSAILATETMNPRVVRVFASTLGDICNGQLREIFDGHQVEQSLSEYELRIYGKTASLFAAAAEMGAILGEATDEQIDNMRGFGADIGMAFQIVDDVLDFRSTTETTGKPVGADLRQGTVTLPTMYYLQGGYDGPTAATVRRIIDGAIVTDEEFAEVTNRISESTAIERSLDDAAGYIDSARARLADVGDDEVAAQLDALATLALNRMA